MKTPVVYVIQSPQRWDDRAQKLMPKYNLESAKAFGDLVQICNPDATPFHDMALAALQGGLADFTTRDHLLLIGNPVLIGWATALAAEAAGGTVNVLQWSGRKKAYTSIKKRLWG